MSIFNCVQNSNCSSEMCDFKSRCIPPDGDVRVTSAEIYDVISNLSGGKASGPDGVSVEHLKYAGHNLPVMLSILFTAIFTHGILPKDLMLSVIVPILKDKNKRITDKNNYRPICLSNCLAKILECIIVNRIEPLLSTCANQFGFKKHHGTDMCVFALKELIRYYVNHGSIMYITFLDATKAFDRVNHKLLFKKLYNLKVPIYLLRLIAYWYCNQLCFVRWGSWSSDVFSRTNGVRQGEVLSPLLFNVYMNDLSLKLNQIPVGCCCSGLTVNHLMYADDVVVFAPSAKGIQKLLDVCNIFGQDNDIVYNPAKSKLMIFGKENCININKICLGNVCIDQATNVKYLGHFISCKLDDEYDIKAKERALYARSYMLSRKFYFCTPMVKKNLFRSYCGNMYLCALWINFRKSVFNSVRVAYNNAFRVLFGLKRSCSASEMFVYNNVPGFKDMIRKQIFSLKSRIELAHNKIIIIFVNSDFYLHSNILRSWTRCLFTGNRVV